MSRIQDKFNSRDEGQFLIGCYLWPNRVLSLPEAAHDDPFELTRVRWRFRSHDVPELLLTANGGLFTHPPEWYTPPEGARSRVQVPPDDSQFQYSQTTASRFNVVICELALANVVSQPTAALHVYPAWLVDGYAMITSSGRGAHQAHHRGVEAVSWLRDPSPVWALHAKGDVATVPDLDVLTDLPNATLLSWIHPHAPTFVASAYYHWFQYEFAQALTNAWIFVEQYLSARWKTRIDELTVTGKRLKQLKDDRNYTAAIKTEVLQTAGWLDDATAESLHHARDHRNNLVHQGRVHYEGAKAGMDALKAVLECVCGTRTRVQEPNLSVYW